MDLYQHDSDTVFRFALYGQLAGSCVSELEQAWLTAQSILKDKELVVDLSGVTDVDTTGSELLSRMREAGARLIPALPLEGGAIQVARAGGKPQLSLVDKILSLFHS